MSRTRTDPYAVLGVSPTASSDEIRSAFRRAVRNLHPDHHVGRSTADHAAMAAVFDAWALLADPDRRASYDSACNDELSSARAVVAPARVLSTAATRSLQVLFTTAVIVTAAVLVVFTIIAFAKSG